MAVKTLVNLRRQAVPVILRDRADLEKTVESKLQPRGKMSVDEGLFTGQVRALIRQKHVRVK